MLFFFSFKVKRCCLVKKKNTKQNRKYHKYKNILTSKPAFITALGMAKIPVPTFPFNTCIIVAKFLQKFRSVKVYTVDCL